MRPSESVGWAWMVRARSSAVTAVSTASEASAISSPAPGPTMPTPSTRLVAASTTSFVRPSLRPMLAARPEAAHRPPADGNEDAIEGQALLTLDGGLDRAAGLLQPRHLRLQENGREHLLAASLERLHELTIHAGQEPVRHLHHRHPTAQCRIDL